jgi:DNA-binding MarR family transcriptional regulator
VSDEEQVAAALDAATSFVVRQLAGQGEVSLTAATTLSTLNRKGACRLTELAQLQGVSQPSMTSLVGRLEKQGFAARATDPSDGRISLISVTDAGREVLDRRRQGRLAFFCSLLDGLSPEDREALTRATPALHKLTDPEAVPRALGAAKDAQFGGGQLRSDRIGDSAHA